MRLVLLGPPAAGKGTQAKELSKYYNIPSISTGAMIRHEIAGETEIGKQAKTFINEGQLVPDELVIKLLLKRLSEDDCKNGYILDGYPRNVDQAKIADKMGIAVDRVLLFEVSDDEVVHRITGRRECKECDSVYHVINNPPKTEGVCDNCGAALVARKDDTRETVEKRLAVYHAITEPLKAFYAEKGILIKVLGKEKVEETTAEMFKALGE